MKIEWNGGECPVAPDTLVRVWFRSGVTSEEPAWSMYWDNAGWISDIIAYEVVDQPAPMPDEVQEVTCWWNNGEMAGPSSLRIALTKSGLTGKITAKVVE